MTVMIPLLMGVYMFLMPLLMGSSDVEELRVAVVDVDTGFGPALGEHLEAIERPRIDVTEQAVLPDDRRAPGLHGRRPTLPERLSVIPAS